MFGSDVDVVVAHPNESPSVTWEFGADADVVVARPNSPSVARGVRR